MLHLLPKFVGKLPQTCVPNLAPEEVFEEDMREVFQTAPKNFNFMFAAACELKEGKIHFFSSDPKKVLNEKEARHVAESVYMAIMSHVPASPKTKKKKAAKK